MYVKTTAAFAGTLIEKFPSTSVTVPFVVPFLNHVHPYERGAGHVFYSPPRYCPCAAAPVERAVKNTIKLINILDNLILTIIFLLIKSKFLIKTQRKIIHVRKRLLFNEEFVT